LFSPSKFTLQSPHLERVPLLALIVTIISVYSLASVALFSLVVIVAFATLIYLLYPIGRSRYLELIWNPDSSSIVLFDEQRLPVRVEALEQVIRMPVVVALKVRVAARSQSDWIFCWRYSCCDMDWRKLQVLSKLSPLYDQELIGQI
jgi:hypothetical protein